MSPALRTEVAANLRLAAPIIAAQITFMGFGVTDTLMAGRVGQQALAAIAVGANLWMQPFVFFMGISMAVSPIVSQRLGAGQAPSAIGGFLRSALTLALPLGLIWLLAVRLVAPGVIGRLGLDEATARLALDYLRAESWGAVLFCLCFVLRNAIEARGVTGVILVAGLTGLTTKVLCNFLLLDALGPVGFGWSAVAAAAAMAGVYLVFYARWPALAELRLFAPEPRGSTDEVREILRLGLPIALILLAEVAFFGCTALLMARFGAAAVAAHQIAISFASVTFMVPLGIALATTVRVGYSVGAADASGVRLRGLTGMGLGMGFALFSAAIMGLAPEAITALYTRDAAVAAQAQTFLRFAALFQLFDCLQATASGALRGLKDTRVPMLITLAAYWIFGMSFGYLMAFTRGHGPEALWWGFVLGLALAAAGLAARFLRKAGAALSVRSPGPGSG